MSKYLYQIEIISGLYSTYCSKLHVVLFMLAVEEKEAIIMTNRTHPD